jgi:DNA-binding NtrC family response regulator
MIVNLKLDLPDDIFDAQLTESDFAARVRELAILELVRRRRLHEHEAKEMLALERYELVERMKALGIAPTEDLFAEIKGELTKAIDSKRGRSDTKTKE